MSDVGYGERPVEAVRKAAARHTWQHAAYADLFAAPYRSDAGGKRPPPLISLVVSMELLTRAAAHMANECGAGSPAATAIGRVSAALNDAQRIVTSVPTTRLSDEAMLSFLASLIPQIKQIAVGSTMLIPINIAHAAAAAANAPSSRTNAIAAALAAAAVPPSSSVEVETEAVVLAAQRRTLHPGRFTFAVISGGTHARAPTPD